MAIDSELEKIYLEDKKQRESAKTPIQLKNLERDTDKRIEWVKEKIASFDETEIWNCHYIAYLLHHSRKKSDYKVAHEFAAKAVSMGSLVTKWLYAATLDRWLVSQGKKQKYGTQYKIINGEKHFFPVDGSVSEEDKKNHGM